MMLNWSFDNPNGANDELFDPYNETHQTNQKFDLLIHVESVGQYSQDPCRSMVKEYVYNFFDDIGGYYDI